MKLKKNKGETNKEFEDRKKLMISLEQLINKNDEVIEKLNAKAEKIVNEMKTSEAKGYPHKSHLINDAEAITNKIKQTLTEDAYSSELKLMDIKKTFSSNSRWSIRKTVKALDCSKVALEDYIQYITMLLEKHHETTKRGFSKNMEYIDRLNQELRKRSYLLTHKIPTEISDKDFYTESIQELRKWKDKYLAMSHIDFIAFINAKIDIPYSKKTLENIYSPSANSNYHQNERVKLRRMYQSINATTGMMPNDFASFISNYQLSIFNYDEIIKLISNH